MILSNLEEMGGGWGMDKKKAGEVSYLHPIVRDSCRIQTCNLLIRSQMLYSVELRSHPLDFVGDDGFEPPTLCL